MDIVHITYHRGGHITHMYCVLYSHAILKILQRAQRARFPARSTMVIANRRNTNFVWYHHLKIVSAGSFWQKKQQSCTLINAEAPWKDYVTCGEILTKKNKFLDILLCRRQQHAVNKNSSGDEIENVNFLRWHRVCRGQRLRPLNRLPNFYYN